MALHPRGDVGPGQLGVFLKYFHSLENHSRRAVATLEGTLGQKRFLDRVQTLSFGQAFNREDGLFVDVRDRRYAGRNRFPIDKNRAGAALALAAAIFRSGQMKVLAQDIQERTLGISNDASFLAVYGQRYLRFHTSGLGALGASYRNVTPLEAGRERGIQRAKKAEYAREQKQRGQTTVWPLLRRGIAFKRLRGRFFFGIEEALEVADPSWVAQLTKGLGFDLADTLACHGK